jgi:hypothetical protein
MTLREKNTAGWTRAKHVSGKAHHCMADAPSVHDGHKGLHKFFDRMDRARDLIESAAHRLSDKYAEDVAKAAASIVTNAIKSHSILATFHTYQPPMPSDRNPLTLEISVPFGDSDNEPTFALDVPECLRSLADSYADTYDTRDGYNLAVAGVIAELESCIAYLRDPQDNHLAKKENA